MKIFNWNSDPSKEVERELGAEFFRAVKTYDVETDGPFHDEHRGITHKPLDRKYVYVRLCDATKERSGGDAYAMCSSFDLPNGKYLVAAITMRDSKKYKVLVELGYEPVIDLKERRNELKRKVS